ncbi:MAG: hypothetical protein RIB41_00300 [Oceanibaculum nanhaiense]|jgi:hypothetical protein|uniref:hypothetical protein n=1 Tax=Oceanibaculum nanhaiense TaxID=1909734 RepID=UPI0032EECEE0
MSRKRIFFKRPPKRRFGRLLGAAVLVAGLSWSLYGGFPDAGVPDCDSDAVRQQIRKTLTTNSPAQASGIEVVSYRENRRRMAEDVVEARDCAARTLHDGTVGIVRYTVLRRSDSDGFHVDIREQAALQDLRR